VVEPELRESYQVDRYQQKSVVVDILWILDNSGSMENERERLAESFERFIQILQTREIDYHLGVISTDPEQARLREEGERRFLTPELEDSQAEALFRAMVEFPQARNQKEQGLEAMRRLLEFEQERGDFLRREAALAVVVVSDEDDGSFGAPAYFSRVLQNSRRPGDELRASFSAIVGLPPEGCTPEGEEQIFGAQVDHAERYLEVMRATGGLSGSVCETDFDPFLEDLGRRVGALDQVFPLSGLPKKESIQVSVDALAQSPERWSYREEIRAVLFSDEAIPHSGSEILIAYEIQR